MTTYYETSIAIPNDKEGYSLEMSVDYDLGNPNFWTGGRKKPRGLKVRFTPVRSGIIDGVGFKSYRLGDGRGRSIHVVDLKRKSDKRGRELAAFVESRKDGLLASAVLEDWATVCGILGEFQ